MNRSLSSEELCAFYPLIQQTSVLCAQKLGTQVKHGFCPYKFPYWKEGKYRQLGWKAEGGVKVKAQRSNSGEVSTEERDA